MIKGVLSDNIKYILGITTSCLLATAMVRYSWEYGDDGCLDNPNNLSLIFRNLFVTGVLYLLVNFLPRAWDKTMRLGFVSWILCRYMLIYSFIPPAISKWMTLYYQFSFTNASAEVKDLEPQRLLWQIYASSDTYEMLIGAAQILVILMLVFRKSTPIAALLTIPLLANNFTTSIIFSSCSSIHHGTLLALNAGIIIYLIPYYFDWIRQLKFPAIFDFKVKERKHFYGSIGILKLIIVIGLMTQHLWRVDRSRNYYALQKDHPLVGIWDVDTLDSRTKDFPHFTKLIFEKSIMGNVEVEDSLTTFYYLVDTNYNQMEFYNFYEFRELDLKGKYEIIDSNTVEYIGRNRKDSIYFTLRRQAIKLQ